MLPFRVTIRTLETYRLTVSMVSRQILTTKSASCITSRMLYRMRLLMDSSCHLGKPRFKVK